MRGKRWYRKKVGWGMSEKESGGSVRGEFWGNIDGECEGLESRRENGWKTVGLDSALQWWKDWSGSEWALGSDWKGKCEEKF